MKSLKPYRFADNPKEKELFDTFVDEYYKNWNLIVFGQRDGVGNYPDGYLTEREENIVASTIQWLGSHVGQGFLKECGFELKEK